MKTNNTIENPMAKNATVKLRIDEQKRDKLKEIAAHEDRSMSYVIEAAIDDRIAYEDAWERGVVKAIAQVERGEVVAHTDVREWVNSLGTNKPLPRPTSKTHPA